MQRASNVRVLSLLVAMLTVAAIAWLPQQTAEAQTKPRQAKVKLIVPAKKVGQGKDIAEWFSGLKRKYDASIAFETTKDAKQTSARTLPALKLADPTGKPAAEYNADNLRDKAVRAKVEETLKEWSQAGKLPARLAQNAAREEQSQLSSVTPAPVVEGGKPQDGGRELPATGMDTLVYVGIGVALALVGIAMQWKAACVRPGAS